MPQCDEPDGLVTGTGGEDALGRNFAREARRALEAAAALPIEARRRLQAAVLAAAEFESERLRRAEASRAALARLSASLEEISRRLREVAIEAAVSLERLREVRRRLERLRSPLPPGP